MPSASPMAVDSANPLLADLVQPVRCKVAVIATHPIQYQAPLWRRLAQDPALHVRAFFGTDMSVRGYRDEGFGVSFKWDTPLIEGYEHEFLSTDSRLQKVDFWVPDGAGLPARLKVFGPDVVLLTAYRGRYHLAALQAARQLGARVVMRHEASDVAETRSVLKESARDWLLRLLYARIDRFAAIGSEARRHLLRIGVPADRVGWAPYCVDSEFMARQIEHWRPQRARLRAERGVRPGDTVLVFSGKLTPKKNPLLITAALAVLTPAERASVHLVVAGDGELRGALEQVARPLLGPRLHLQGFLNQSEIGQAYALGDALVLPSLRGAGETWGLVVNEAMQFRLPAIVSDGVGCHPDLVTVGRTGFVFTSGDVAGLANSIRTFLGLPAAVRELLARGAEDRVREFSLEAAACGLVRTIRATVDRT